MNQNLHGGIQKPPELGENEQNHILKQKNGGKPLNNSAQTSKAE